jgi:tetratricopeptide (TPR) repeat protein
MTISRTLALLAVIATSVTLPDVAVHAAPASGGAASSMPSAPARSRTPEEMARSAFNSGVRQIKKADGYSDDAEEATRPEKRAKAEKKALAAYEEAAEHFQKSLEHAPANHDAWNYLGYAQRHVGRNEAALASYARALKLKPGFPEAIEYRAEAYTALNRFDEAREAYMDLFGRARPLADRLLASMKKQVAAKREAPDGVAPEALEAFAKWVEERATIAQQTASLSTSSGGQNWR